MKIKDAIKNGFKLFPDGQWRIQKTVKKTGYRIWQRWNLLECKKCGCEFLGAHKDVRTCGKRCAVLGERRALGCRYERPRVYRVIREGYAEILEKSHGNANRQGRVLEHRFVISKKLGRPLLRSEHVHHINGDKLDNREENLVLLTVSEHMSIHNNEKLMEHDKKTGRFKKLLRFKGRLKH